MFEDEETLEGYPSDDVHGPSIRRALLSKLINASFGVVLKEVNARYTNLAANKKMKLARREELKVISTNSGGAGGGTTRALHPFNDVIAGRQQAVQRSVSVAGAVAVTGVEEGVDYDAMLGEYAREMFQEEDGFVPVQDDAFESDADEEGNDEVEGRGTDEW